MTAITLACLFALVSPNLLAQSEGVSIGTTSIDPSAVLHLDILDLSTPKGFLPTRMNSTVRGNIVTPANGLIIFNTETNTLQVNTGSTSSPVWVSLISSTITGDLTYNSSASSAGTFTLVNSGVASGTYGSATQIPILTVDSKGRITSATFAPVASNFGLSDGRILVGNGSNLASEVIMSGDATISNTGALTLSNSGVFNGTYGATNQFPIITIDSKGRITSATFSDVTSAFGLTNGRILVGDGSNIASQVLMSGDATLSNTGALTLANTGVTSGTFGSTTQIPVITLDAKGRITSATFANITAPNQTLTNGNIFVGNASNVATDVTMSGDATISNTGAIALANTGVTSGTFGSSSAIPVIAVDSKGRLTYSGTVSLTSSGTTSLQAAYDGATGSGSGRSFTVGSGAVRMIGTNAADVTLNVTNSANGGALLIDNTGTGNSLRVTNGSSTYLTLNSTGSLALGASAPNELLTLDGVLSLKESAAPSLTAGYGKIYATSNNELLYKDESGTISMLSKEYAIFRDSKTSGSNGGTAASGAWNTRELNETLANFGNSITRSSNNITLATAGTYKFKITAPASAVNGHQIRLRNTTDNAVVAYGTTAYTPSASDANSESELVCIVTVSSSKDFVVEHRVSASKLNTGYGFPANLGNEEVYTVVQIERIR